MEIRNKFSGFEKVAIKLQQNKYLNAISSGLASLMPIIIVGSLFVVVDTLNIEAYQSFLESIGLKNFLNYINMVTNGMLSIYAAFSIAYNLARQYKIDGFMGGLMAIMAFMLVQPFSFMQDGQTLGLSVNLFGAEGIFTAIVLAILVIEVMRFCIDKGIYVRMPKEVPEMVERSFKALTSTAIVIIFCINNKDSFSKNTF